MPVAMTTAQLPTLAFEDWVSGMNESQLICFHESGHAVAFYVLKFQPRKVTFNFAEHDRRTTRFLHRPILTPADQLRALDYAVTLIAGSVAEAKYRGVPLADLRNTFGKEDYQCVYNIIRRVQCCALLTAGITNGPGAGPLATLEFLEARAIALTDRKDVWSAVESVVAAIEDCGGTVYRADLVEAIESGLTYLVDEDEDELGYGRPS
jgi:hypothetical protein